MMFPMHYLLIFFLYNWLLKKNKSPGLKNNIINRHNKRDSNTIKIK